MTTCRTCNDTGMIPTSDGWQPCPRCEAYERIMRVASRFADDESRARVSDQRRRDDDIPSEWVAVAAYLAALALGLIVIAAVYGALA